MTKKKLYDFIFLISMAIFISLLYIGNWGYETNENIIVNSNIFMLMISCILAFISIIYGTEQRKMILLYILALLSVIFFLVNKQAYLPEYLFIIYAARYIDDKKIIQVFFFTHVIFFVLSIILSKYGIIEQIIVPRYVDGQIIGTRYGLGIGHPNKTAIRWFTIIASYYCLYYKKNSFIKFMFFSILTIILYRYNNSRTGLVLCELFLMIMLIKPKFNIFKMKLVKVGAKYLFIIVTVITCILPVFGEYSNIINQKLSLRPMIYKYYLTDSEWGISLLGKYVNSELTYYPLDNSYIHLIVKGGIFIYLIYMTIITLGIKKVLDINKDNIVIVLCFFIIYGMLENTLIDYTVNFALIIISKEIFNVKTSKA